MTETIGKMAAMARLQMKYGTGDSKPLPLRYKVAAKWLEECEPEHKALLKTMSFAEAAEVFDN